MSEPMASTQPDAGPSRVFLSYARQDRLEKDALTVQLAPLERQGLISIWSDEKISPGEEWLKKIDQALGSATIGVLLISASFLASDFIVTQEVPKLLNRHANDTIIYPIIIKPCAWQAVNWLNRLQVKPRDGEPVWRDNGRFAEQELAEIALDLAQIAGRRVGHPVGSGRPSLGMPLSTPDFDARPIDFGELKRQATAAIQVGAPEYNSGNVGACARRYARVVSLVQKHGIEGAIAPQAGSSRPMGDGPYPMPARRNSMPSRRISMPGRRGKAAVDAGTFLSPAVLSELTELYRAVGSIEPGSSAEDLDYFAWQARYCFDRTLEVSEIAARAADALNNSRHQLPDIQGVFERIDRAASEIYWPDWPQKLTSIDSGIKLVASMLSSVISEFLSAGILEDRGKMPAAAASELESVIREYDEAAEDPYRLSWILHSFMMRFVRRT
ncbi:MAG TPA: toll/interleukin-1 receptor domain-containing protein [Streptosporangiaceae bacterium]|jgi:hypothetical protein